MAEPQTLPQPKTFAPSREDVLSSLAFFFGDPATPEKLKDYSEHHAMCASPPFARARIVTHAPLRAQDLPFSGYDADASPPLRRAHVAGP